MLQTYTVPFDKIEAFCSVEMLPACGQDFDETIFQESLESLSPIDRDIFRLYYIDKLPQSVISSIFNLSQGDISYRLKKRIIRHFRAHYFKSKINLDAVFNLIEFTDFEKELLKCFMIFKTQMAISEILGKSQSTLSKTLAIIRDKLNDCISEYTGISYLKDLLNYEVGNINN